MAIMWIFLWPLLAIPFATAKFAQSQGRSFHKWLILGFAVPLIPMLVLFFLPDLKTETAT
jgi:hypothetical protein